MWVGNFFQLRRQKVSGSNFLKLKVFLEKRTKRITFKEFFWRKKKKIWRYKVMMERSLKSVWQFQPLSFTFLMKKIHSVYFWSPTNTKKKFFVFEGRKISLYGLSSKETCMNTFKFKKTCFNPHIHLAR
jgi:hypothetical protein